MKQEEQEIKQKKMSETAKYFKFNQSKIFILLQIALETPMISTAEIKLKFDKLANYLDDYKRKLYLSDDIELKPQIAVKKSNSKKRKKAKNYLNIYKNVIF